ncbi:MAG: DUF4129 domain-containing protein [Mycobacterium sp.]
MPTIDIDRDAAREAAQRELAKPIYPRQSPKQQFIDLVEMLLRQLVSKGAAVPGGWFTISILLIVLAVAVVASIRIARRTLRTNRRDHPLFGPAELSAAEHRTAAEHCAASGDWAAAIRHRLRAVARELEQAGVLNPAPGRTANELARDAGAALPELDTELIRAAETFNDVSYGELPATTAGYRIIAELDDQLRSTAHRARSAVAPTAGTWRQFP